MFSINLDISNYFSQLLKCHKIYLPTLSIFSNLVKIDFPLQVLAVNVREATEALH